MWKRRILWAAVLLLTALLYFFDQGTGTLTLLVSVVLLPLLGLLPLLCSVSVTLSAPAAGERGERLSGAVSLENLGVLPLPCVLLRLTCRNLRTGEEQTQKLRLGLLPKQTRRIPFRLDCPHCGTIRLELTEVAACDLFGLAKRPLHELPAAGFSVLPVLFQPEITLSDTGSALPDSDVYATDRPGNDPGELFAVREYVPGDHLRKIHWKLSGKLDDLMVREFGLPIVNEALLLLETGGAADAAAIHAVTEVFASVSHALLQQGCPHRIGWRDNGVLFQQTVSNAQDFDTMLDALLRLPSGGDGSVAQTFSDAARHGSFAHILVVSAQPPAGISELVGGNRVSVLLCGDAVSGLAPDGCYLLPFDSENYAQTLCCMEV